MKHLTDLFAFAAERQRVLQRRRAGEAPPWTIDPVLQQYRFCNVYREDDRTTVWFRDRIRGPLSESSHVLLATIACRWFNWIPSMDALRPMLLEGRWDIGEARRLLRESAARSGQVVTGAFVVHSPNGRGMDKVDGLTWCIDQFAQRSSFLSSTIYAERSLEKAHRTLLGQRIDSLGPFMAYEVVTDLRHTYLLRGADDVNSWASAGPGAARGLAWVTHGNLDKVEGYGGAAAQARMNRQMQDILIQSRGRWHPSLGPPWEMREVEHTLCEFDKFRRAQTGQRLKRKFNP